MDSTMLQVGGEAIPKGLPKKIVADAEYLVQLSDPVPLAPGVTLSPAQQHTMSGTLVEKFKDSIYGAIAAEPSQPVPAHPI